MTNSNDSRDRAARSFPLPISETLSRYFSMTSPGRPRREAEARGTSGPQTRSRVETQRRAEELWDSLADFA
jgi:hypothetical protein